MKYSWILFLILMTFSCQTAKIKKAAEIAEEVDRLFADYSGQRPGASVMVIKEGEVVLERNYGLADMETGRPVSSTTNFRLASVSKQFTAMALMQYVAQEYIDYDHRLQAIFPEFPDYGKDITVRHLLTHRSGLVDYGLFLEEGRTDQILDLEILVHLFGEKNTLFPPGSRYEYSNTGYAVLAMVVSTLGHHSFAEEVQRNIFDPLGMQSAQVYQAESTIEERAYGYWVGDSIVNRDHNLTSAVKGDGGVYMSISDYFLWDQALYTDELIPQEHIQQAFTPWGGGEEGYGFGWRINTVNGLKVVSHGGSSTGFGTEVIRIPELELTVVAFTNRSKRDRSLLRACQLLANRYSDGRYSLPEGISWE